MLSLLRNGAEIREGYLSDAICRSLLDDLEAYKASHNLPLIERTEAGRSLRYRVIDGDRIFDSLPEYCVPLSRRARACSPVRCASPAALESNRMSERELHTARRRIPLALRSQCRDRHSVSERCRGRTDGDVSKLSSPSQPGKRHAHPAAVRQRTSTTRAVWTARRGGSRSRTDDSDAGRSVPPQRPGSGGKHRTRERHHVV